MGIFFIAIERKPLWGINLHTHHYPAVCYSATVATFRFYHIEAYTKGISIYQEFEN